MAQGPRGDLHIYYRDENVYEHWDWSKTDQYARHVDDLGCSLLLASHDRPSEPSEDCLVLRSQKQFHACHMYDMKTYWDGTNAVLFFLYRQKEESGHIVVEARHGSSHCILIPSFLEGELLLKVSTTYLTVASENGYIYVILIEPPLDPAETECMFYPNRTGPHARVIRHFVLSNVGQGLGSSAAVRDEEIVVKTAVFDGQPIYDLVGSWLVYCPSKKEVQYHKQMHLSESGLSPQQKRHNPNRSQIRQKNQAELSTPVKLPLSGPLLNRVLSSVSNTAADRLFKLSDVGSKTMQSYLNRKPNIIDKDVSLHSISSSIGGALLSTVDKLKKQAASFGDGDTIRVMDLRNGQTMAFFKPPGGVSHLSLSPYDLHLVHANLKGDSLYMWDLYKLPNEVSLAGKFVRGKTSASIRDVVWFFNDDNAENLSGTNFGFGVITKRSGSVHWYNVNYLSGGSEANNYPNMLGKNAVVMPHKHQFADSWILPSARAVKFCKLPALANVPADTPLAPHHRPVWSQKQNRLVQLAFIDSTDNMRLVSPLNGSYTFKYILPVRPRSVPAEKVVTRANVVWKPDFAPEPPVNVDIGETPLSQAEIETCEPYLTMVNDDSIEFTTYDFGEDDDAKFFDHFREFGEPVPVGQARMHLLNDLEPALATSDSEHFTACVVTSSKSSNAELDI